MGRVWTAERPSRWRGVATSALDLVPPFDATTDDLGWQFSTEGFPWSSPAVADGVAYVGSAGFGDNNGAGLWAIDAR